MGKKKRKNSRDKGARGELEFSKAIADVFGCDARRGRQFSGIEGRDVVSSIEGIHWEVKRVERFELYPAVNQAIRDAKGNVPVVATRRNSRNRTANPLQRNAVGEWILVIPLTDVPAFVRFMKDFCGGEDGYGYPDGCNGRDRPESNRGGIDGNDSSDQ